MDANQKIQKAFDNASGNSPLVHLSVQEANTFIDYIVDESTILKEARVVRMNKPNQKIAKIGINSDVFKPAVAHTAPGTIVEATTDVIELQSKEIIARVQIFDDELEDNIEGASFKDHFMRMVTKKGANEIETALLYGSKVGSPTNLLGMFDGWIKILKADGNAIDVDAVAAWTDKSVDKTKLAALYKLIPTKFQGRLDRWYMPSGVMVDYELKYETSLNRVALDQAYNVPFKKVPNLALGVGNKTETILTPKDNLIFGIQRDITIEYQRNALIRGWDVVITARIDNQVEEATASGILYNLKVN